MIVGSSRFRYKVAEDWGQLPKGWRFHEVCGVAVDSQDRVYVFDRDREHPIVIFDRDGNFWDTWGNGIFNRPHSIRIGADDSVYCVDTGDHTVRKFTNEGKLLMMLGNKNRPSDTGCNELDYRAIKRGGPPFNRPTDLAFAPSGEIFVSDGYGNARVHKFSTDGTLLLSWGEVGSGPGEFAFPHSICVDKYGKIYVADRENNRIQVFTLNGELITEWTGVTRPDGLFIDAEDNLYIAELGYRYGLWPWMAPPGPGSPLPRLSVWNLKGELLAHWGGEDSCAPGNFCCPHMICTDSRGDLYVSEVNFSGAGKRGLVPIDCHTLQKFVRTA